MRPLRASRLLPLLLVLVAALMTALATAPAAPAATPTLYGTVGPNHTISFTTAAGVKIKSVTAGRAYVIVVKDKSDLHNFHLRGASVSRQTSIEGVATQRWTVTFKVGTYTFLCDAHPASMIGTFVSRAPAA